MGTTSPARTPMPTPPQTVTSPSPRLVSKTPLHTPASSPSASVIPRRASCSSVFTTSVPELVHSLSSSREVMPTDRLSAAEVLTRPASSSLHRQTKSLAEAHLLMHANSSTSLASAETAPPALHDRSKSTSEVEGESDAVAVNVGMDAGMGVSVATTVPMKNPNRKKSRTTSYSPFPTTAS